MTMAAVDLFGWREMRAAEAAVSEAHAVRALAARKVRCAPHGLKRIREQTLAAATTACLQAEAELAAVQREFDL